MNLLENQTKNAIFIIVLMLLSIGIIMVYSSSAINAKIDPRTGNPYFFLKKQLVWTMLAVGILIICMSVPYRMFHRYGYHIFGFAFLLIVLVLIPGIGSVFNGARRWIRIAGMGIQPSDFMKLAMVLFIACYVEQNYAAMKKFFVGFLPVFSVIVFSCFLILLEPDFGTSSFIMGISMILLIVAGISWRHLFSLGLLGMPFVFIFAFFKFNHIRDRIMIYLNPSLDPYGKGFQIRQSLITLGSGGKFGVGLGYSQQKLFYLSEENTDFIFAVIGEELGLMGTSLIIVLYILLIYYGLQVVKRAPDIFSTILSLGIILIIGLQTVFNIAVVTHTIPAKGISLPLISFGGSGLFFTMMGVGILLNIAGECEK